jgi:hypothetical protein
MIWIFKCATENCIYNSNEIRIANATNPVLCGACFCYSNAFETDEPAPIETFE